MIKLIISKNRTKCRKCGSLTYKIENNEGPDESTFYMEFNKLMCASCGYVYFGELKESKRIEREVSEENYQKMLDHQKKIQSR